MSFTLPAAATEPRVAGNRSLLVVGFPLEGRARVLNSGDLNDAEIIRIVDWIGSHPGFGELLADSLDEWRRRRNTGAA